MRDRILSCGFEDNKYFARALKVKHLAILSLRSCIFSLTHRFTLYVTPKKKTPVEMNSDLDKMLLT